MLSMLLLSNLRLVVYLFGAIVFASMSWLYFDAMYVRPQKSVFLRGLGALLISLSYLVGAAMVEGNGIGWVKILGEVIEYIRIGGYLILGFGVWGEPLSKRPGVALVVGDITTWVLPILPGYVGLGYLRRASVGLERHLRGMAYGMYVLSLAEILDLRRLFLESSDIRVYELARDFGSLWGLQLSVLLIGFVLVSRWVFSYLLRRFETQITLFMAMLVVSVFALATMVFTYVMGSRLELGAKREVASASAMTLNNWGREGDSLWQAAGALQSIDIADRELLTKQLQSGEHVLDMDGRDILTGEKREKLKEGVGYALSGSGSGRRVVMQAIRQTATGYVLVEQEIASQQLERSASETGMAVRLYDGETVIGSSSVPSYSSIASPLGLTRSQNGRLGGVYYTSAQLPLKSSEGVAVAMLETAQPTATLWASVSQALFWTYLVGVMVLLVMEAPAIVMARYLTRQLR